MVPSGINVENILRLTSCPVTLATYSEVGDAQAVALVAKDALGNRVCGHTMSEGAAKMLLTTTRRCPECRVIFSDYVPNRAVQQLAAEILLQQAIPVFSAKIPVEPGPDIASIPFPGKGAHFELINSGWDRINPEQIKGSNLCRSMAFRSGTPDSFFSKFEIYGYGDGDIALKIEYNDRVGVINYLTQCGVFIEPVERYFVFQHFRFSSDMKTVFRILALHNEIPEPHFSLAAQLIEAGNWKQVTPLPALT